tara:strand:- start:41 stop:343 length:303 start_codon:yes stop_codon:yes gene_type:complete
MEISNLEDGVRSDLNMADSSSSHDPQEELRKRYAETIGNRAGGGDIKRYIDSVERLIELGLNLSEIEEEDFRGVRDSYLDELKREGRKLNESRETDDTYD